jgi:hypothetical protein
VRYEGHITRTEEFINTYTVMITKPELKSSLGRSRRRWSGLKELENKVVDSTELRQGRSQ